MINFCVQYMAKYMFKYFIYRGFDIESRRNAKKTIYSPKYFGQQIDIQTTRNFMYIFMVPLILYLFHQYVLFGVTHPYHFNTLEFAKKFSHDKSKKTASQGSDAHVSSGKKPPSG